jgi:hypothetical protein
MNDTIAPALETRETKDITHSKEPKAIITWLHFGMLKKILSCFKQSDLVLQMECNATHLSLYAVINKNILLWFDLMPPLIKIDLTTEEKKITLIFSSKILCPAIRAFSKAALNECDEIIMTLHDNVCKCIGNQGKQLFSEINVKGIETNEKFEHDANDIRNDFGYTWFGILHVNAKDLLRGVISLDQKEVTTIVLEDGKLFFKCEDESKGANQKQYVPMTLKRPIEWKFEASIMSAGMQALQGFIQTASNLKVGGPKTIVKEVSKKRKVDKLSDKSDESIEANNNIELQLRLDPEPSHPVGISFRELGIHGKIFVTTRVDNDM